MIVIAVVMIIMAEQPYTTRGYKSFSSSKLKDINGFPDSDTFDS